MDQPSQVNAHRYYSYRDADRRLKWIDFPNDLRSEQTYDAYLRLIERRLKDDNNRTRTLARFTNARNGAGQRTQSTGVLPGGTTTSTYGYDALGRLTRAAIAGGATTMFGYDRVGNRPQSGVVINDLDQPTAAGVSYDVHGNLRSRAGASYGWDSENRLVSRSGSGARIDLAYDVDGNRVWKDGGGRVTYYLVDDLNPTGYAQVMAAFEEVNGEPVLKHRYLYGKDLLSRTTETASGRQVRQYYHHDELGSVRLITGERPESSSEVPPGRTPVVCVQCPAPWRAYVKRAGVRVRLLSSYRRRLIKRR